MECIVALVDLMSSSHKVFGKNEIKDGVNQSVQTEGGSFV